MLVGTQKGTGEIENTNTLINNFVIDMVKGWSKDTTLKIKKKQIVCKTIQKQDSFDTILHLNQLLEETVNDLSMSGTGPEYVDELEKRISELKTVRSYLYKLSEVEELNLVFV